MKRKALIYCAALAAAVLFMDIAGASAGWRLRLDVKAGDAKNTLVIGQAPDALDARDPVHDVPAMLAGDIQARFDLEGYSFWQDIRKSCGASPCSKTWSFAVSSGLDGETMTISWDPSSLPLGMRAVLTDSQGNVTTDMASSSYYSYINDGDRGFTIEISEK